MSFAKRANRLTTPKIYHLCDVESNEPEDVKKVWPPTFFVKVRVIW